MRNNRYGTRYKTLRFVVFNHLNETGICLKRKLFKLGVFPKFPSFFLLGKEDSDFFRVVRLLWTYVGITPY